MTAAPLTLDHVLLAAPSEQHARRALDAGQLTPSHGSALPGTGLANLVCPLGDTFLEVLHPSGGEIMASMAAMRDTVLTAAGTTGTTGLAPVGYMLRVPDARLLAAATDRLALPILAARSPHDPSVAYRLVGLGATLDRPWLPVLIHWDVPLDRHPGRTGRHAFDRLSTHLAVAGDEAAVDAWCAADRDDTVTIDPGERGPHTLTLTNASQTTTITAGQTSVSARTAG